MATTRQKKVARLIVENAKLDKPLNGGEILEKTGYAPGVIKNPSDILESKGVQEELEVLGFTEYNAKKVVQEIMLDSDADNPSRLKAAEMVFKVHGTYAPEKHANLNVNVRSEDITLLANKAAELLREKKI